MSLATLPKTSPAASRRGTRSTPGAQRPTQNSRVQVVAPDLRIADSPAASVLRLASARGPISRDVAARATGLSIATVNRQVASLLGAGLLRERGDLTTSGAIGRPRVPFEVNHEPFSTVGIHIGALVTGIVVGDLRGRILGAVEIPTPGGPAEVALRAITRSASAFAARWHRRTPLWVGVALGGRVDAATGSVDHPRLGWENAQVGTIVGGGMGLPVSVSGHVEAMAASELLLTPARADAAPTGTSLFFYARETAGIALTIDGRVHTPSTGPGSIAHLPTGSNALCACGNRGCLEASVSDRAVLAAAIERGVLAPGASVAGLYRAAHDGSAGARDILVERAEILGRTVGLLRDLFNPDRVVLGGQAFTEYEAGLPYVAEAFGRTSTLPRKDIRVTGFGNKVQEYAAAVVSLSSVYSDPLASMRRAAA
ncbi:ROK family protein [Rhodococcus sp. BP-252]|uniref:ROK family transcriptional regulator n=1 Tax=unclassified Rhodococcus (in: high G+C Gram-positive bacteria) TaxID=192944 RepID=UPI0016958CE9|nr:ROK family protein [Rhodococcus sp. BP-320]MBY6418342.1 ROK family protein [Rhodococcus sp. BP-321]MBY6422467.1 ROK family protein [Rhodococcus sp. BP-324]MBY6428287.1 ROK family protein [Rhodococcus sp. BP-323]MBY6433464.1 ROK family protein [Rhodococcus sp. BP-322]MBY6442393.1 ROK family protein [Rhodococcus sp. BP-319]MBY6447283.1 ROK family protein [Rhodococcus sp. BP-318]MBY6452059.1 ROK family protein [Rhodococcus sp. BP-315]MBY6456807.1 ROK family protein [Rhodococcus sp. BP-277]